MAASLGSLVVSLGLDAAQFTAGLTQAEYKAQRFARDLARDVGRAVTVIGGIGAAAVGAALALENAASSIAVYKDLADVIGDTGEAVASLQTVADVSGTSLDSIASASVRLTASLSKTDDEAKGAGAALKALNIPFEQFKQLSPVEQLEQVARSLRGFKDGAEKTAVAVALFGKSGAQLIPFLKELGDQSERQVVLTDAQIEAADRFSDSMTKLRSDVTQLGRSVVADLLPPFQAVIDAIGEGGNALSIFSIAGAGVRIFFETVAVLGANVIFVFSAIGREVGAIAAQIAALARGDMSGFRAISEAVKADAERARRELQKFEERVLNANAFAAASRLGQDPRELARRGRGPATLPQIDTRGLAGPDKPDKIKKVVDETARYLEQLQKQLERTKELTAVETVLADIENRRITGINAATAGKAIAIAQEIDARKRLEDQLKAEEQQFKDFQDAQKKMADEGRQVFEATRTPLEKYNAEIERLNRLYATGAIDAGVYARAVGMTGDAFAESQNEVKKQTEEVDSIAKDLGFTFSSAFEDAIVEGGKLSDVLKGLEQDIIRIVTRRLITEPLGDFFTNMLKGAGGSGGSGNFIGSIFSSLFGGKAGGGPVMPGGLYEVAENRPETLDVNGRKFLMMGNQRGNIDPNPHLGGARTINAPITVNMPQGTSRQTMDQAAAVIARRLRVAEARMP
jgi:hypothetical protein